MKLVLIYRKKHPDAFSIEELFATIARELRTKIEVVEYKVGSRLNFLRDAYKLRKLKADIYHVTGDVHYFIPVLPKGKTVLTIHDINHFLFGLTGIKRQIYKWVWLLWPIRTATVITCISEETKKNISLHLKVAPECLMVIQNCYNPLFYSVPQEFNSIYPTILQIGTKPHKNVPRLVRALKGTHCRLVLIGKIDEEITAALLESSINYVNYINLTHEQLMSEYVACDLVAFVSMREGFGVPIIEAQAVGRPLLTSDISPLREIAGAGACLVNPLSEEAIRDGICRLLQDRAYRDELVEKGLINAQRFSVTTIAAHYLAVYKKLTNDSDGKSNAI